MQGMCMCMHTSVQTFVCVACAFFFYHARVTLLTLCQRLSCSLLCLPSQPVSASHLQRATGFNSLLWVEVAAILCSSNCVLSGHITWLWFGSKKEQLAQLHMGHSYLLLMLNFNKAMGWDPNSVETDGRKQEIVCQDLQQHVHCNSAAPEKKLHLMEINWLGESVLSWSL